MIERQDVDERPEAEPFGALRNRGEEHARRGCHAERRRMVFGDVIGMEADPVIGLDQSETGFVVVAKRDGAAVEMIEYAELHGAHPAFRPMWSARG